MRLLTRSVLLFLVSLGWIACSPASSSLEISSSDVDLRTIEFEGRVTEVKRVPATAMFNGGTLAIIGIDRLIRGSFRFEKIAVRKAKPGDEVHLSGITFSPIVGKKYLLTVGIVHRQGYWGYPVVRAKLID